MDTVTKIGAVVLALALLMTGAQAPAASAAGTVILVNNAATGVGQEITVPVYISDVTDLYGADVRLTYDPTILTGVRVDHGYFLQPGFVVRQGFYGAPACDPMCARYALTQLNPTPPASGDGVLMYVTFRALRPGTTSLTLFAELATRDGELIPHRATGGVAAVLGLTSERR